MLLNKQVFKQNSSNQANQCIHRTANAATYSWRSAPSYG